MSVGEISPVKLKGWVGDHRLQFPALFLFIVQGPL
jgi:hypothetical protein